VSLSAEWTLEGQLPMKRKPFSVEQIVVVLKQAEAGNARGWR
jgi:hypothetical protein